MRKFAFYSYRPSFASFRGIVLACLALLVTVQILRRFNILSANSRELDYNQKFEIRFKNLRATYWMNFSEPCPPSTKLVILSLTRRDGFENRDGIRQTWMAKEHHNKTIRFLMADAQKSEDPNVSKKLEEEQAKHGDLIFIHGFEDNYRNLTLKTYAGFQWQKSFCPGAKWVLKADDDTIVDLRRLDYWIGRKFGQLVAQYRLVFMGEVFSAPPIRQKGHKWYVSKDEFPADEYPRYMHGPVYLTTPGTLSAILRHTKECNEFSMEDVLYTGVVADAANATRLDLRQHFSWGFIIDKNRGICEDGVPSVLSLWGAHTLDVYKEQLGLLRAVKCEK